MVTLTRDQAPARWETCLAVVCPLIAILGVQLVAAPNLAWAANAADGASRPPDQHSLAPAPMTTNAPAVNTVADTPSPSRWAQVPLWQKVLGVGASLVGLAAVGTGAYLLWLNGQAACSAGPRGSRCPYSDHQTALAGWLIVAGGAATSLGGVTLVLMPPIGGSRGRTVAGLTVSASF